MKKWTLSAVLLTTMGASATTQTTTSTLIPDRPLSSGEFFQDMSKAIPNRRIILSYGLEIIFKRAMHLTFPAPVRCVDLGPQNIIADRAEDAGNVLRVKTAVKDFETETDMSVICEDDSFCAFNMKYVDEPEKLSVETKDFLSFVEGRLPSNRADIYFKELDNKSPVLVELMMQAIYRNDKRTIRHIGARQFGTKFLLRGLYAHNGLLHFHTRMENETSMPYSVGFVTFKVVNKKVTKRTAIQKQVLRPFRAYHQVLQVHSKGSEYSVFVLDQFSFLEDKQFEVTLYGHNGGRTLTFHVKQEDLLLVQKINGLRLKW